MVSRAKLLANRRNARKSTGPRTEEGKRVSSQNALSHGLYSDVVVATGECEDLFQALRLRVIEGYKPQDQTELAIVEEIAVALWKLRRLRATESAWLDGMSMQILQESGKRDKTIRLEVMLASQINLIKGGSAELISRMEVRLQNSISRSIRQLEKVRKLRAEASELPASPIEFRVEDEVKVEAEVVAAVAVNQICETKPNLKLAVAKDRLPTTSSVESDTGDMRSSEHNDEQEVVIESNGIEDHGWDARDMGSAGISLEMLTYSRVTGFQPVSVAHGSESRDRTELTEFNARSEP